MNFEEKYNWFLEKSKVDYKKYQHDGIKWCVENEQHLDRSLLIRGGFIADEMGLGKTITMIATLLINILPNTLIVLPNILLDQWRTEILRTTGHKVLVYHGENKKTITLDDLKKARIVLTTYGTITVSKRNLEKCKKVKDISLLHQMKWNRIVFDEGHHLRNKKTSRFLGAKYLRADIRWLMSGTPIQNRCEDFYSLCSIVGLPATYYKEKNNLVHLVTHYVLRRTKKQVGIVIPSLQFQDKVVEWRNENERQLAQDIHMALETATQKLPLFIKARQSCILPEMLHRNLSKMSEDSLVVLRENSAEGTKHMSKIDQVASVLLSRKGNGNGKIVFCHFRREIDIVKRLLVAGGIDSICAFDGRVSQATRFRQLDEKYEVIIMQIQTGCEGLNLQKDFNEIYFVSPNWNPAIEDQAIARCHRIGQQKEVHVFRFYMNEFAEMEETMDGYISHMQTDKREIANEMFQ
jgi:SNF2 family DNA or RNA helicase